MGDKKKVKGKTVLLKSKVKVKQAIGPALGSEATQARGKVDEIKGKAGS